MKCPNFLIVIGAELITSSSSTPALCALELQTKVREDFTITEKAPTKAFSCLKEYTFIFHI